MASPCFPYVAVQQFTYSLQEVIKWARSKTLDTINIPPQDESLGATARSSSRRLPPQRTHCHHMTVEDVWSVFVGALSVSEAEDVWSVFLWMDLNGVKRQKYWRQRVLSEGYAWVIDLNTHDLSARKI